MDLPKAKLWDIVKAICTLAVTAVLSFKVYQTPVALTIDFPTFLSLLLALFSVALAALFYFKATDTSNTFYDNTYKFTRDIAQLLAKMESGFGERLRHLDEGYSSMRTSLEGRSPAGASEAVEKTKQKLEEEKEEVHKVVEQRNRIVKDLLERSQLQASEKEEISTQLKKKEDELSEMQQEMTRLNKQLFIERVRRRRVTEDESELSGAMDRYTKSHVLEALGVDTILESSGPQLQRLFNRVLDTLPKAYTRDMERREFFEDGLTPSGVRYLKSMAKGAA